MTGLLSLAMKSRLENLERFWETRLLSDSSTRGVGYCCKGIQLFIIPDCLAEIRKRDYTTFSLLLRQCPWPRDGLQGPVEGPGFPGGICVVCVFTRSMRSTCETKVGTAWCNKTGLSTGFLDYIHF